MKAEKPNLLVANNRQFCLRVHRTGRVPDILLVGYFPSFSSSLN